MEPLHYTIIRRAGRKTVSIRVRPDGTVQIIAPAALQNCEIDQIAEKKRRWIVSKLQELKKCPYQPVNHHFQEGELFLFMGSELSLRHGDGRGRVIMDSSSITVEIPVGLHGAERLQYVEKKLRQFYKKHALDTLKAKAFEYGNQIGLEPGYVAIKDYRSRWGCCFSDGRIYFNWKLIMSPEDIIDYVVIHELCHLREPNHSKNYWAIVEHVLPDWKERRKWLRLYGHILDF